MLKALHPLGIREKALHKHLNKHRDFLQEVCVRPLTGMTCLTRPEPGSLRQMTYCHGKENLMASPPALCLLRPHL